jgi:hypothetical protein
MSDKTLFITAKTGSWIKDNWRKGRSLGFVSTISEGSGMMHVTYPKIGKSVWLVWENNGHYKVIN